MMVKRSGLSSFMASAFVFPGGAVEISDYSSKWLDVFQNAGVSGIEKDLLSVSKKITGPRPPMVTDPQTIVNALNAGKVEEQNFLPADIALRIAAIRETFEETGVLLLTDPKKVQPLGASNTPVSELDAALHGIDLSSWREKVRNDGSSFLELCSATGLCPDIWSLYDWSNWLTPISVGHKRFDTMFFVICLDRQPKVVLDNMEVTTLKWCTPLEMLEEHTQERVFLAPPQVYELSRIHHLSNFSAVKEFSSRRDPLGSDRWLPVLATYKDGAISFLPGDTMYPEIPDIIGKKPVPDYPQTVVEMRSKSPSLNRIELRRPICQSVCNVKLLYGHLSPITYPPMQPESSTTTGASMM